jgi:hypothetical protein
MQPCVKILCSYIAINEPGERISRLRGRYEEKVRTESLGSQLLEENRVRRSVAFEDLALEEHLVARVGSELLLDRRLVFPECEGLGLGEEVGEENLVVEAVADGVLGLDGGKEVGGNEFCALVDELR